MNGFQNDEIGKAIRDIENKKKAIAQASNNEQNVIKQKINEAYGKIGESAYALYVEGDFNTEKLTETFESLKDLHKALSEKQAKLDEILSRYDEELKILRPAPPSGQEACPNCSALYIPDEMLFCSSCGSKLPEKSSGANELTKAEQLTCANCGVLLPPDSIFCTSCGNKI